MSLLEKLVRAVEKRRSLWFPGSPDPNESWEDVAEEVLGRDNYYDWFTDGDIEEKALYCQEEWEHIRDQYLHYMEFLDKGIYLKQSSYKDGYFIKPIALEFLHVSSNRVARLEAMQDRYLRRPSFSGYKREEREEYTEEDQAKIQEYFSRPHFTTTLESSLEEIWEEFENNGEPSVPFDPDETEVLDDGAWGPGPSTSTVPPSWPTSSMRAMVRDIVEESDEEERGRRTGAIRKKKKTPKARRCLFPY